MAEAVCCAPALAVGSWRPRHSALAPVAGAARGREVTPRGFGLCRLAVWRLGRFEHVARGPARLTPRRHPVGWVRDGQPGRQGWLLAWDPGFSGPVAQLAGCGGGGRAAAEGGGREDRRRARGWGRVAGPGWRADAGVGAGEGRRRRGLPRCRLLGGSFAWAVSMLAFPHCGFAAGRGGGGLPLGLWWACGDWPSVPCRAGGGSMLLWACDGLRGLVRRQGYLRADGAGDRELGSCRSPGSFPVPHDGIVGRVRHPDPPPVGCRWAMVRLCAARPVCCRMDFHRPGRMWLRVRGDRGP